MAKKQVKKEEIEEIKSVEVKKEVTPIEDIEVVAEEIIVPENIPVEAPIEQIEAEAAATTEESTDVENLEKMMADKVVAPKYEANDAKIEKYLRGAKPYDMITQRKKGGPFIGGRGEIYIPLSLIKK